MLQRLEFNSKGGTHQAPPASSFGEKKGKREFVLLLLLFWFMYTHKSNHTCRQYFLLHSRFKLGFFCLCVRVLCYMKHTAKGSSSSGSGRMAQSEVNSVKRVLLWFRNDLRIHDNYMLWRAAELYDQGVSEFIPFYSFDPR